MHAPQLRRPVYYPGLISWSFFSAGGAKDIYMNKSLDFVFVGMPVETAEGEWCDFLTTRKEVPASHQIAFIPAIAGSFLVCNEIRYSGLVPALRRRWTERGTSTAKLLRDFQNGQSFLTRKAPFMIKLR
jgi:hypothetical protein